MVFDTCDAVRLPAHVGVRHDTVVGSTDGCNCSADEGWTSNRAAILQVKRPDAHICSVGSYHARN